MEGVRIPKITEEELEILERPISKEEFQEILASMEVEKSTRTRWLYGDIL